MPTHKSLQTVIKLQLQVALSSGTHAALPEESVLRDDVIQLNASPAEKGAKADIAKEDFQTDYVLPAVTKVDEIKVVLGSNILLHLS